jgi:ubiquinone/menaquinone biosynthesis C-methylase UbiE
MALLAPAVVPGTWAELGCGRGAFTLALAELLGADGRIHALDKDGRALDDLKGRMTAYPQVEVRYTQANFTKKLDLEPLDGLLMANSLHFVRKKGPLLARLYDHLKPGARFILVEYNADRGNLWVPHPISFPTWQKMAAAAGFHETQKISAHPSRFMGEIFSAISHKPPS